MTNQRFAYRGPAEIDGVLYPVVQLQENPPEGGLRSWEGAASFSVTSAPDGFNPGIGTGGPVTIELPDGRKGQAHAFVSFHTDRWTVDFEGTGPAPA